MLLTHLPVRSQTKKDSGSISGVFPQKLVKWVSVLQKRLFPLFYRVFGERDLLFSINIYLWLHIKANANFQCSQFLS